MLMCTTARSFLARTYPTMKKHNPNTPIMLREAAGTQPRVYARYGQSEEHLLQALAEIWIGAVWIMANM